MTAGLRAPGGFAGRRWRAARLGLRLAGSSLGGLAIGGFYALWGAVGVILSFVLIPVVLSGKLDAFNATLNPVARYGFLLPMALLAGATWAVNLCSRVLWCCLPTPRTATVLAFAAVAGRLAALLSLGRVWLSDRPFGEGLLMPETIAGSGIAVLGLIAEWGFIRALGRRFRPAPDPASPSDGSDPTVEEAAEAEDVTEQKPTTPFTRDLGAWFKGRFPRAHGLAVWVLLPVAYVTVSSLAAGGHVQAVPEAILRLGVIAPAFLQVFWVPGDAMDRLIDALSPRTARGHCHPTGCAE